MTFFLSSPSTSISTIRALKAETLKPKSIGNNLKGDGLAVLTSSTGLDLVNLNFRLKAF